ncbi:MAG: hypothetical protein LT102_02495 [Burkholderiaceae bacterium]|nr:hypothetical protein [Burkholderiaceae bacterium]
MTLVACGGGGSGDGADTSTPKSVSGRVVDGYVAGATVQCMQAGTAIATTLSGANGVYAFDLAAGQSCEWIESRGGLDVGVTPTDPADDIPRPNLVLRAPVSAGAASLSNLFVTPASTLVQALVAGGRSVSEAHDLVRANLGVSQATDLLATDPASDLALYRIDAARAQIIEQVSAAIAAAGAIVDDAGFAAASNATIQALAASLAAGTTLTQLEATPLAPTSPLVALITQATSNAKADATIATRLTGVQPQTLALVSAPLVASAARQALDGASLQAVVDVAGDIAERGGAATVVGSLVDVLDEVAGAGQAQAILDAMTTAAQSAAAGTSGNATITVGATSVVVQVPGGASNFLHVGGDTVHLYGPTGGPVDATLAQFGSASGVTVPQNLSKVGLTLAASADFTQLAEAREVPLAIDIRDATGTRVVQAIVDRVRVSQDAGGVVQATVPAGATATVYGKTASAETVSPLVITLSDTAKPISTAAGEITIDIDRLFSIIGGVAASGSPLARLAADRISGGTFVVTLVVGDLRIAHATSSADPTPTLGVPYTVQLQSGGQAVVGYGVRGRVLVGS